MKSSSAELDHSEIEAQLIEIWSAVLKTRDIGCHDNFFEIGGHSLLALKVRTRIEERLGTELKLSEIFDNPTVSHLAAVIGNTRAHAQIQPLPIDLAPRDIYPLSDIQERLWFLHKLEEGGAHYNIATAFRIQGALDFKALESALNRIVERHDSLRTRFIDIDGKAQQFVEPHRQFALPQADLRALAACEKEAAIANALFDQRSAAFDLRSGPIFRILLVRSAQNECILSFCVHHIAFDGWSRSLFSLELATLYNALSKNLNAPLPALPIQYPEYAYRQCASLQIEETDRLLSFWKSALANAPTLDLPTDRPRRPRQLFKGGHHRFSLSPTLRSRLETFNQSSNTTSFTSLLSAYNALLSRYSGQKDIAVGTPFANRLRQDCENLIGVFANTLVLRTDLSGSPSFRTLVARSRSTCLQAFDHQELSFERLVEALNPIRDLSRSPIFTAVFALQSAPDHGLDHFDLDVSAILLPEETTRYELELHIWESKGGFEGHFSYSADLFDASTIACFASNFEHLLAWALDHPDLPIEHAELNAESERIQTQSTRDDSSKTYPRFKAIHHVFEDQADNAPNASAIECNHLSVSYRELDEQANRLARYLIANGAGPGKRVGVYLDRSSELVTSFLAILKAGAAYVPLAKDYPVDRLRHMLEDASLELVIVRGERPQGVVDSARIWVDLADDRKAIANEASSSPEIAVESTDAAYVIYTSGSTGLPKGTVIPHRGVVRLVKGQDYANFDASLRSLFFASPSFDASTFEIWGPLLNGGCCVIFSSALPDLTVLEKTIRQSLVNSLWLTAGLFNAIIDQRPSALATVDHVLTGGEALSPVHVKRAFALFPFLHLTNGYGPTECTTFATTYSIDRSETYERSIPIGSAISNTQTYILDADRQLTPVGGTGELYIGGDGLAIEYLNQPILTAEKFVANPFSDEPGSRLYRTGDLCRYLPDGRIDFMGRIDHQVKIRGFRVELTEIEAALLEHPLVREATAVARQDEFATQSLAVYYVPNEPDSAPSASALRTFLEERVPRYALPNHFVALAALPLTPNGKVDRAALPEILAESESAYEAPQSPLEKTLADIWQATLNLESVGTHDNFFELGGHSLLASRVVTEIDRSIGRSIPIAALFQASTITELARYIETNAPARTWRALVPLRTGGDKPPVFCMHGYTGEVFGFLDLAGALAPDRPVYGLQATGLDGLEAKQTSIEEMAKLYASEIRSLQPQGPYHLLGHSMGGWIAYAVALELKKHGGAIGSLGLLDTQASAKVPFPFDGLVIAERLLSRLLFHAKNWRSVPRGQRSSFLKERLMWMRYHLIGGKDDAEMIRKFEEIAGKPADFYYFANVGGTYRPPKYRGDIDLFVCYNTRLLDRLFWSALVRGKVKVHKVPGNHDNLISTTHVEAFAKYYTSILTAAEQ